MANFGRILKPISSDFYDLKMAKLWRRRKACGLNTGDVFANT
jgi:hypothetical protein